MNIFSKITAKTMRANRVRTIVTIIGVILSTSMITAVATFGTSFQRFLVDYSISTNGNWHVAASGTDAAQAGALAKHPGICLVRASHPAVALHALSVCTVPFQGSPCNASRSNAGGTDAGNRGRDCRSFVSAGK